MIKFFDETRNIILIAYFHFQYPAANAAASALLLPPLQCCCCHVEAAAAALHCNAYNCCFVPTSTTLMLPPQCCYRHRIAVAVLPLLHWDSCSYITAAAVLQGRLCSTLLPGHFDSFHSFCQILTKIICRPKFLKFLKNFQKMTWPGPFKCLK